MNQSSQPTAAMLVIGDEILSGRTKDANAALVAEVMTEIGVALEEIRVVPDRPDRIVEAVRIARQVPPPPAAAPGPSDSGPAHR